MEKLIIGQSCGCETVAFAARELERLLRLTDPSLETKIVEMPFDPDAAGVLWVGPDGDPGFGEDDATDTVKIGVSGMSGVITGSNPRSVLIAVYRFMRELGCRFIRPGRDGEKIPQRELRDLSVSVAETASYRHRGVCIEGADSYENVFDMIDFLPKVGMNEYFIQFMVPTEFFMRWYAHVGSPVLEPEWKDADEARRIAADMTVRLEKEIKKRSLRYQKAGHGWTCEPFGIPGGGWFRRDTPLTPEQQKVLAEVNGERQLWGGVPLDTNLCYSNDEVRATVTDAITAYAAQNPQIDAIHFWLADGYNNHCECENCRKMRPADWYVRMLNELDEKMTASGLETKIVFLIYVDLLWEPKVEKIRNPGRFILMFAPITRSYGQNYGDCLTFDGELPPYVRNRLEMPSSLAQNVEHLRRWQADFDGDSFAFDYHLMWAHVGDIGYEKCARNLFCDMKDLKKLGLDGMVSCQIQRCFWPTSLPFLAMAAALWDSEADFDRVADDYYRAAFGDKADAVRGAMKTLSRSCGLYEKAPSVWDRDKAYSGREELLEAVKDAPDPDALAAYAEYLGLLFGFLEKLPSQDKDEVRRAADALFDWMWKNEMRLQRVLDVRNSVGTLERLIK